MMQAGFREVNIVQRTRTARIRAVGAFVLQHLAATPEAGAVEALSDSVRMALAEVPAGALRPCADGDGMTVCSSKRS
jgi:hypothetical protein